MAAAYAKSRAYLSPLPYRISTAPRYAFSRAVGAFAARATGVGPNFASAFRAAARSCCIQIGWLKVIASPQYAIANPGSIACARRKSAAADSYSKLWS